jgi:hypothetical protein
LRVLSGSPLEVNQMVSEALLGLAAGERLMYILFAPHLAKEPMLPWVLGGTVQHLDSMLEVRGFVLRIGPYFCTISESPKIRPTVQELYT